MASNPVNELASMGNGEVLDRVKKSANVFAAVFVDKFTPTINAMVGFINSLNESLKSYEPESVALGIWENEGGYVSKR